MPKSPYFKKTASASKLNTSDPLNKTLPDYIDYDLRVLFVGINPGLVDRPLTFKDDVLLTADYGLGITNLSTRTTRKASDLTVAEQRANAPELTTKLAKYRPKVACFVGKGIYEIFSGRKKGVAMGLQPETIDWANGQGQTKLFVMPSTSGIVSAYQKPDKLKQVLQTGM